MIAACSVSYRGAPGAVRLPDERVLEERDAAAGCGSTRAVCHSARPFRLSIGMIHIKENARGLLTALPSCRRCRGQLHGGRAAAVDVVHGPRQGSVLSQ